MTINIQLNTTAFQPEGAVSGKILWDLGNNKTPKNITVRLKWMTKGKGSVDQKIVAEQKIPNPNPGGSEDFYLKLPAFPWSYEGKLFSLLWFVEAEIDKHLKESIQITCGPQGTPCKIPIDKV